MLCAISEEKGMLFTSFLKTPRDLVVTKLQKISKITMVFLYVYRTVLMQHTMVAKVRE